VVRDAVIDAFALLPAGLKRSLAWDQGKEMALHAEITQAAGLPVFFCEKASPWQRPSNENTVSLRTARKGWSGRVGAGSAR
jgi:transposase, IS30 family